MVRDENVEIDFAKDWLYLARDHLNVSQEFAMTKANVSPDPEAARIAAAYATKPKAIDYVMGKLAAVAGGKSADLDFISSREVSAFCTALGFEKTWSGRTIEEIARKRSSKHPAVWEQARGTSSPVISFRTVWG